jgi:apolipoprotein N-acyltransferase
VLLAILSGVLTALAFPKFGIAVLAWVSLIPLLYALRRARPGRAFRLGTLSGLVYYGILLYWIPAVPAHYGGTPLWLCVLIFLALIGFLALYWGIFGLVLATTARSWPTAAFLLAPLVWLACEYLMTYVFTGFPWGILGTSQYRNLPFIQVASLAGVYGVSFVLVFLQSTFVLAMTRRRRGPFFMALGLMALVHAWGGYELKRANFDGPARIKASVIQGNVSSDIYWDVAPESLVRELFDEHLALSRKALAEGSRLIIWPEFTVPLCFSCEDQVSRDLSAALERFVRESGATLLVGTNEVSGPPGLRLYHNTAMALHPDLSRSLYFKMHLVPFGEYTPARKIFFFIEKLTHAVGDITPGTEAVLHEYQGFSFGSPICYEIVFPAIARRFTREGAGFLVTITNDGWYGTTAAPYQHWAQAVFRAVENRRYLLRAATTGISGAVDPFGRVMAKSRLMTKDVMTETIAPSGHLSFYTRTGDALAVAALTAAALSFILALIKQRKGRHRNGRHRQII